MIDRNVEFPNRFRMTLVPGTDDIYEVVPAPGDVIAAGDTFSKVNMLPDSIPAALGLKMGNPQVKDALNVLANIGNVHVWQRVQTLGAPSYELGTKGNIDLVTSQYGGYSITLSVSDNVNVASDGEITQVNATSMTLDYSGDGTTYDSVKGKFVRYSESNAAYRGILFIPSDGTIKYSQSGFKYTAVNGQAVVLLPVGAHVDYLTSTDRNAYPDESSEGSSYLLGESESKQVSEYYDTGTTRYLNLSYSDSVVISGDGSSVELNNPTTVKIGANASANFNVAKGKFCKFFQTSDTSVTVSITDVVFIPSDANFSLTYPNGLYTVTCSKVQSVTVVPHTITYLGQLGEPGARIEVGNYVGTGTYGSRNPNSLTFGFVPRYVRIIGMFGEETGNVLIEGERGWNYGVVMEKVPTTTFIKMAGFGDATVYSKKSSDGKTLYWYDTGNAVDQYNESGVTYYFLAIG